MEDDFDIGSIIGCVLAVVYFIGMMIIKLVVKQQRRQHQGQPIGDTFMPKEDCLQTADSRTEQNMDFKPEITFESVESPIYVENTTKRHKKAKNAVKGESKATSMPATSSTDNGITQTNESNMGIQEKFNLADAVIYSEIMRPKYLDEE